VWTFDHKGVAYATMEEVVKAIPATIAGSFDDDPFRSLSEYIRDKDGYIKCKPDTPTADFPQVRGRGGGGRGWGERGWGEERRGEERVGCVPKRRRHRSQWDNADTHAPPPHPPTPP
jgi:hypothetical protein